MGQLILKRASASRPSGEWNDDDYDVLSDGVVVGRTMNAARLGGFVYRSPNNTAERKQNANALIMKCMIGPHSTSPDREKHGLSILA